MMSQYWVVWIGSLALIIVDLCVSVDDLRSLHKPWFDDVQVKNNAEERHHVFRKYCESTHIKECERGQYREWRGPNKGLCMLCNCNCLSDECDPHTGKCLNCQFNTAGDHCERCMEGYYGNAALRTCSMCPCPFTDPSNSFALGCLKAGDEFECLCKPGYSGTRCERCALGYYGNPLAERGSCQPCDCGHAYVCDPLTGDCFEADDPDIDICLECDDCVVTLMNDLEAMDAQFSSLKTQLELVILNATSIAALKKLEDALAGTKVLVDKYSESIYTLKQKMEEFETDIENVKDDLTVLNDKAIQTSCSAVQLLETLDKTYQRGDDLHSESVNLLQKIFEFLDQIKQSNHTDGNTEEVTKMFKEARRMLEEMRRQNCKVQRELAKEELQKAKTLFNLIMDTFMVPLNGSLIAVDRIGQNLMDVAAGIKDIQEALIDADLDVIKANDMNNHSEAQLANILKYFKVLEKEQRNVMANVNMTRRTLKNTDDLQNMMEDLAKEMSHLAAQVDGAKNNLNKKLDLLSQSTSKEGIVRRAEEHAQDLMNLAMDFQMAILNVTNSSAVHNAIETIKAFTDVTDAIREAEKAANRALEAANRALKDVQGQDLQKKANNLKDRANNLLVDAKDAQKDLQDVTKKCEADKDLIQQAEKKQNLLRQAMQDEAGKLKNIKRDDIGDLIQQAKEEASNINGTASDALARIHNISEELNKTSISSNDSNVNNILNDVNKTLAELDESFPSLIDKLNDVENQSEHLLVPANMSNSIQRIKDLIEKTRDMANRVRGPIFFSGDAYVELRPPKDTEDLRAFTALNLTLHRPEDISRGDESRADEDDNLFVLYLGNKHTFEDYVGLVVRKGVLFCVYKLGGIVHEIETIEITKSSNTKAFMDRVDFRRVYQDAQVIFTKIFTSSAPLQLPPMTYQAKTTVGLLNLDPGDVVLYVGGYPTDFTPPEELRYPGYKGCIEFSSLNDHILGLYNFQHAVKITSNDKCLRGNVQKLGNYFDGTGYGKVNIYSRNTIIRFNVLTHQTDAVLLYMENKNSYYFVKAEGGYIVLQGADNDTIIYKKTQVKVFPQTNFYEIRMMLNEENTSIQIKESLAIISLEHVKGLFQEAYIGGVPTAVREKYNIDLPSLKGCVNNIQVDITATFVEEVGIVPGCPNPLLGVREVTLEPGSALSASPSVKDADSGTMISFGFKTLKEEGVLLQTSGMKNGILLYLVDSFVEMSDSKDTLKSKNKYETGKWHYVTAFKNSSGMLLNVDNTNTGDPKLPSTPISSPVDEVILGGGVFEGCLRNLYIRSLQNNYFPADLSGFNQSGSVSLGSCNVQRPPVNSSKKSARHAKVTSDTNKGLSKQDCRNPRSIKHTYHLSFNSQLQFKIDPEKLNDRPQFSLYLQTKSSDGLIIHITGKQGVPLVFLYLTNGKVKLTVGEEKFISPHKINDGNYHHIKFRLKRNSIDLAVDGVPTHDVQLLKGSIRDLQSPVYVGHGQHQIIHKTHEKAFPQKSVIGCIRDFKFSKVVLSEPAVNYGAAPCFKGMTTKGAYFAGDGAHVVFEKYLFSATFDLAFEFWPRNQTGLLFHKRDQHGRMLLTVFLKRGKVVVKVNDGRRRYGTTVTPTRPLCSAFHYLTVSVRQKTITLRVGEVTSRVKRPTVSWLSAGETIYIGGISENNQKGVEEQTSYVGCLRNLYLNHVPLSFKDVSSLFGPVNTNECPAQ